jgi:hypothetical protein
MFLPVRGLLGVGVLLIAAGCSDPAADPPALSARVTLSIGALDDPDYTFSRIEGISVGPDGHIFVLQHEDANIREYDSTGEFVRLIGRRGMGPGEFSLPTKMWWSEGSLWVADGNLLRATRFDRNGTAVETRAISGAGVPLSLTAIDLLRDGSLLAQERVSHGHPTLARDSTPLVRIRDSVVDTILWLDVRNTVAQVSYPGGQRLLMFRHPFADNDVHRIQATRDTIMVARRNVQPGSGRAELLWFDLNGRQLRSREFELPLIPVSAHVRDSVIDNIAQAMTGSGRMPSLAAARAQVTKSLTVPQYYPPFDELHLAPDGSIWVRRGQIESSDIWLIIDQKGTVSGKLALPPGIRVLHVTLHHAWAVRSDPLGVPKVVRLTFD